MLVELKRHIMELDNEIEVEKVVFDKWTDYKEYGQHEDSHKVALLEQELTDNQATFDEQSSMFVHYHYAVMLYYTIHKRIPNISNFESE